MAAAASVIRGRTTAECKHTFKLVIVGDKSVGKSSVLRCIQEHTNEAEATRGSARLPDPTAAAPSGVFLTKNLKIDGEPITLQIWQHQTVTADGSPQEILEDLYKDVNGVIVVYDVTNQESFDSVKQKWVKEITMYAPPTVTVMILGNKNDSSNRVVTTKTGRSYATKQGFQFKETSTLKNENVNQAIERMVKIMIGPVVKDKEFLKAVHKGKGEMTQLNVVLHGPPGVGKTSLKQIILGLPPLPKHEQNATNILENAIRAVAIDRANSFKEISNEELIKLLADTLVEQIREQATVDKTSPKSPAVIPPSAGGFFSRFWNRSQSESQEDIDTDPQAEAGNEDDDIEDIDINKARNIRLLRDEIVFAKPSSSLFQSIWHHLIDSGGQPQFQDMLPSVFRSPSFQIVLMRLTERLDEKPKMQYIIRGENAIESPEDLPLTNLQYIERACQIAASCDPPSKVMIIGTHKDKLDPDNLKSVLSKINGGLFELSRRYKDVIIPGSNHTIFDMNTMAVGEEREQYMKNLREMISGVSSKWAKPEDVKLKWLCFHLAIDKEETGVVKYGDCLTVGNSLGMKSEEVTNALEYFSNKGLLLYYKEIPEIVLTKVNPLIDRLSELIRASFSPPSLHKGKCDDFRQRGTFNKAFIDDLFPDTKKRKASEPQLQSTCIFDNTHFLNMLIHLKLAVEVGRDEYFIPSALSFFSAPQSIPLRYSESCGFALEHRDNKCILPHSFFFTTAIELQSSSSSWLKRGHLKFELRRDDQQYRDRIQFYDKSNNITDVVILTDNKWWIEVTVANNRVRPTPKTLQEVRRAVKKAITKTRDNMKLKYSIKKVFPCPEKDHTDHYCTLINKKSKYQCSVSVVTNGPGDRFHCWSGKPYTELPIPALEEPPVNIIPPTAPPLSPKLIWSTTATHSKIFDSLKSISVHWNNIARKFDIEFNTREKIRLSNTIHDDDGRLDAVINQWIQQQRPPVTWETLHGILIELDHHKTAQDLASKYAVLQQDLAQSRTHDNTANSLPATVEV